jgi:hypothetical protein
MDELEILEEFVFTSNKDAFLEKIKPFKEKYNFYHTLNGIINESLTEE